MTDEDDLDAALMKECAPTVYVALRRTADGDTSCLGVFDTMERAATAVANDLPTNVDGQYRVDPVTLSLSYESATRAIDALSRAFTKQTAELKRRAALKEHKSPFLTVVT